MDLKPPPLLDKHHYFFKGILECDPEAAWRFCRFLQRKWNDTFTHDNGLAELMTKWKCSRSIRLVWLSDKFGGTLPNGVKESDTYTLLSKKFEELAELPQAVDCSHNPKAAHTKEVTETDGLKSDAEKDRYTGQQLVQHLEALHLLTTAVNRQEPEPLSSQLIKSVHEKLMNNLYAEGKLIVAGEYRSEPVHSGNHTYPDFSCIPDQMEKIITEYNTSYRKAHDPFQLASWLLLKVLSLHPFLDGNGRVSRLLWCFSLLRDGLPFPVTPFPGIKKGYKKYISCIQRDEQTELSQNPSCKCLTSLTVISIVKTWENFLTNLKQESPKKFDLIFAWLEKENLLLH